MKGFSNKNSLLRQTFVFSAYLPGSSASRREKKRRGLFSSRDAIRSVDTEMRFYGSHATHTHLDGAIVDRMANPDRTRWRRCTPNARDDRVRYVLRPSKVEPPRSPLLRAAPECPATKSRNYMRNFAHAQRSRERFIEMADIIYS